MTLTARLVRLDGPTAGQAFRVTRSLTVLGSHPAADHHLPGAAPRHAALIRSGATWLLRDLQGGTGSWVNGARITGDMPLAEGDEVRLGPNGPTLRFERAGKILLPGARPRWLPVAVGAGLLVIGGLLWQVSTSRQAHQAERAALLARLDTLVTALDSAVRRADHLDTLLTGAAADTRAARTALRAPPRAGPPPRLDSLAQVVRQLAERQAPLLRAANLDLTVVARGNQDAVALVLAERPGGTVVSGTGFAIRRSADTSWIVTSRHVVADSSGQGALRLGVVFNGTAQNFPATLARLHPTTDLALLRVVIRGGTPVVRGVAGIPELGAPVGTITFPGELDLEAGAAWRQVGVAASTFRATVVAADSTSLALEGYGAEGMSGSPIFGQDGLVVGVIFGGASRNGGRVVLAVPGIRIGELLGEG